jgi:hypothetical protein
MQITKQTARLISRPALCYTLLALLYTVLIFTLPASKDTMRAYNLSAFEYRIILFANGLPSLFSWLAAFFAYGKLREYAYAIRKSPEGPHFATLATGATWLAWSLPIPIIVGLTLNSISYDLPGFRPTAIIMTNYLNVFLPLIAFSIIGSASRGLVNSTKVSFSLIASRMIMFLFLTAGVLYCYLTFRRFDLTSLNSSVNPYFLPIWLMVLTVTIPYLYTWFIGLLAAYEINIFSKDIRGVLYRQALRLVAGGFMVVIACSIALQYINSAQPRVGHLLLNYTLVLNIIFRIIRGIGFIVLAIGAMRLKRIEEI